MNENESSETPVRRTPGRVIDPLSSWRRHRARMPILALVVFGIGAPLAWISGRASFYAEAAVRVSPSYIKNLEDQGDVQLASTTQYQQFVQQQVTTIRSFDVAVATLNRLGDKRGLWQRPEESERRAAERLMATLRVQAVRDTYLVTIGLQGDGPDGLAEIVNAVAAVYVERSGEEGLFASDVRVQNLAARGTALQAEVDRSVARIAAIAEQLGVSTFDDTRPNPFDAELKATGEALEQWRRQRVAAEARLAALQAAQERERKIEIESAARELLHDNQAVSAATRLYHERRNALLAQASGLAADHPGSRAIQRQLAEIEAELERVTASELTAASELLARQRDTRAAQELSRAELEVEHARKVEAQLAADHAEQQSRIADYSTTYQTGIDLVGDVRRARKRIESIRNRIDAYTLEAGAPGFVRLVSSARVPDQPMSGGRRKLLMLVALAAIGTALAAPIGLDRLDPRIVVPGDLEAALGFAPMAWIARRGSRAGAAAAPDQVRRLALAIDADRRQSGTRRVSVSTPRRRECLDRLLPELATDLARLGVRALVVETQRLAGAADPTVPAGASVEGPITRAHGGDFDRLWLGQLAPEQLFASRGALHDRLTAVQGSYDVVLIDAPGLLESAASAALAETADLALLVVPAGEFTRGEVEAAARILERISPPAVASVLAEVRVDEYRRSFAAVLPPASDAPEAALGARVRQWIWA